VTSQFIEGNTPDAYTAEGVYVGQTAPVAAETEGFKAPGGGLRQSIRDRIVAARPYSSENLYIEAWDVTVEVRSLTLGVRNDMMTSVINEETGKAETERLYPELIIRSTYDPETGERVFSDDDQATLNGVDAGAADKIAKVALRLSGMTDDAKDTEAGKSSETGTSVSPS
jgi:hypothetical protein